MLLLPSSHYTYYRLRSRVHYADMLEQELYCFGYSQTMAILTMAILTMAILTITILTMAILTMSSLVQYADVPRKSYTYYGCTYYALLTTASCTPTRRARAIATMAVLTMAVLTLALRTLGSLVHYADAPSKSFPGLRVSLAYKLLNAAQCTTSARPGSVEL